MSKCITHQESEAYVKKNDVIWYTHLKPTNIYLSIRKKIFSK